jgi:hypothetical protein
MVTSMITNVGREAQVVLSDEFLVLLSGSTLYSRDRVISGILMRVVDYFR